MDVNTWIALAGVILALPAAILAFLQIQDRRTATPPKVPSPTRVLAQTHSTTPQHNYVVGKFGLSVSAMFACISSIILAVICHPNWFSSTPLPVTTERFGAAILLVGSGIGWLICEAGLIYCTVERKQVGWLFVVFLSVVSGIASIIWAANGILPVWLYPSWILSPVLYGWLTKE